MTLPSAVVLSIAVVIPALNEEASLPLVLRRYSARPGAARSSWSTTARHDRTAEVAQAGGARWCAEPERGYGSACLRGLAELAHGPRARPTSSSSSTPITATIPTNCRPWSSRSWTASATWCSARGWPGNREPGAMPPQSVWGNRLACFLMRLLFGARYTDLGPFRAIRWDGLERLGMCDRNFGWTVEMQIKAARRRPARLRGAGLVSPARRRQQDQRHRPRHDPGRLEDPLPDRQVRAGARVERRRPSRKR